MERPTHPSQRYGGKRKKGFVELTKESPLFIAKKERRALSISYLRAGDGKRNSQKKEKSGLNKNWGEKRNRDAPTREKEEGYHLQVNLKAVG